MVRHGGRGLSWRGSGDHSDARPRRWLEDLRQDLRFALRQLRQSPGFAALAAVTLAIGIGANATMAGAIDRLLLRPPPEIRDAGRVVRLVRVGQTPQGNPFAGTGESFPTFLDLRRDASSLEAIAGYFGTRVSLGTGPDAIEVRASLVTDDFFSVFGVTPELGRFFTAADGYPQGEVSGGPPLAVVSHGFWQRQFGGDSGIVGRSARIGSARYTIAGVAPRGFRGVEIEPPDVWLPVYVAGTDFPQYWTAGNNSQWLSLVARIRPGASAEIAGEEATRVRQRQERAGTNPDTSFRIVAAPVIRGRGADAPREVRVALWLGGVSALVLLMACANVANLLLGRAFARRREIAVRLAMGARRGRLARQLLAESLLLAGLGAAGAVWVALMAGRVLPGLFVTDLAQGGFFVDARLFVFTTVIASGTGTLVSFAPLLQAGALDLTSALRTGAAAGGGRASRVRAVLLGAQASLCMLLLVGAGLFGLSLRRVEQLDLGLDPERTWRVRFDVNRALLPVREEYETRSSEMLRRVASVPGVARASRELSLGAFTPYSDLTRGQSWWDRSSRAAFLMAVDSGHFRASGARSLRGRDLDATDHAGAARVAVITAPLARLLWPGREAMGECLYYTMWGDQRGDCVRVVGVVGGSLGRDLLDQGGLGAYIPLAQRAGTWQRPQSMYVRVLGDPEGVIPEVRRAIQAMHPELPAVTATRMSEWIDPQLRPWRLAAVLFAMFGAVALVIAVVGLYGVVAFTVAQRSSEIAVRIALGARRRHVLRVVAGTALRAVAAGLAAGSAVAFAVRGAVGPLLFQTSPGDPRIIAGMASLLLVVAFLASVIPVLRVLRRNPAAVLRVD